MSTRTWSAIVDAAGLPAATDAAGRARVAVAAPLPLGISGEREVVDVYLVERLPAVEVRAAVVAALPAGWTLADLHDIWTGAPSASAAVVAADYRAVVAGAPRWAIEDGIRALLAAAALPRQRRREKRTTAYDLRPLVVDLGVRGANASGVTLWMRLRHGSDAAGRPEELIAALGEPPAAPLPGPLEVRSIVRERLVLADDPDVPDAV